MNPDSRLPELFAQAAELHGEERAAFLAALRDENEALAREVEELLAAATAGERRFATPAWEPLPREAGEGALAVRDRIGPYRILREIGRGGMGRVFLAEQVEEDFRRQVALKLVDRPMAADETIRRFREEVRILASLEHPGIARFFDGGRAPDGTWFLALEYVEGEDLLAYARRNGLDLRQRVELVLQVLDAVDFAHRRLIVHRDLKPGNVLVGADGRTKLLDFGVSKFLDPDSPDEGATRTELRALTPAYASPEQLRGERVTIATDVYSLGVMLYEILAGRRPFARRAGTGLDLAALQRDPEPPSTAARQTAPTGDATMEAATLVRWRDLTGDLDAITLKALRAEPESRYRSAAAFAEDLRRWLDGEPVEARRGGRRYRLSKFVRRHRAPVGFGAVALVSLVAGAVIAVAQARSSARERDRALEELRRAEITNDFSAFLLSEATPGVGKPVSKGDLLARGEAVIDQRFAGDPALRVHMLLTLAERYYENYQFDEWKRSVEHAFELSRALSEIRLRARSGCTMAFVHASFGDQKRASALIAEALRELAKEPDATAEEAGCRVAESNAAVQAGDAELGIRAGERALELERLRRGPPGRELEALNSLANAYSSGGRFAAADRTFRELMALFEAQGRDRTHGAAICLNNWAVSMQSAGRSSRGAELSQRAVALAREVDPERGAPPTALWTLGMALSLVGRHEEAIAAVEEAVAKARPSGSPVQLFWTLAAAAGAYLDAGRQDLAEERLRELQAVARSQPNLPVPMQAGMERYLARAALRRGDAAGAVRLARSALERLEAAARPPREVLPTLLVLASALNASGDFEAGRAAAERALGVARERLGGFEHSSNLGLARLELGLAQAGAGDEAAARESLRDALASLRESLGESAPDTRRAFESLARLGG